MNEKEAMAALRSLGTAQNRKVYARHGVTGDMFGVSYANLGKLRKRIKRDQRLAEELWATGNHDARALATMIGHGSAMTAGTLDAWVVDVDNHGIAWALGTLAAQSKTARKRMEKWTRSRNEWIAATGWNLGIELVQGGDVFSDEELVPLIEHIEENIHTSTNRVRYSMNGMLIAIGCRTKLTKKAIAAAKRIGKVEVDHGETSCKTPDAVSSIEKTLARKKAKAGGEKS